MPDKKQRETNAGLGSSSLSPHLQARILAEALPHMQRYDGQTVVI